MNAAAPSTTPVARTSTERRVRETSRLLAGPLDRLNFGCGTCPLPGWTNIDNGDGEWYDAPDLEQVIKLDIFDALGALADSCAACVYSEHVFEHFTLEQGHRLLREWFRVLKPGGVVRVVCPDLESEAKLFLRQIAPAPDETIDRHRMRWLGDRYTFHPGERLTRAMVLNAAMRLDGHKFIYDEQTLSQSMTLAGFTRITRASFGRSEHAALRGIDCHDGGETGREWVPTLALVMEATKTGAGRPPALGVPPRPLAAEPKTAAPARVEAESLRRRVVELTADLCAARGYRRIALYGAGRHTAPIVREPWASRGVRVAAVLDDAPKAPELSGVRVCTPSQLNEPIDAVVVSSDAFEPEIARAAERFFRPRHVPVVTIYADPAA